MLFHASISARNPRVVAGVIAELWRGKALPFPPCPGGWIAFAGDERGSAIEVLPIGTEFVNDEDEKGQAIFARAEPRLQSATHLAIASPLSETYIRAIAAREGWPVKRLSRDGFFDVMEFWVEGMILLEVLTPEMQAQYRGSFTIQEWQGVVARASALVA